MHKKRRIILRLTIFFIPVSCWLEDAWVMDLRKLTRALWPFWFAVFNVIRGLNSRAEVEEWKLKGSNFYLVPKKSLYSGWGYIPWKLVSLVPREFSTCILICVGTYSIWKRFSSHQQSPSSEYSSVITVVCTYTHVRVWVSQCVPSHQFYFVQLFHAFALTLE